MPNSQAQQDAISFVNFNQDSTCISVGTQSGFKIFNCDPFGKCFAESKCIEERGVYRLFYLFYFFD